MEFLLWIFSRLFVATECEMASTSPETATATPKVAPAESRTTEAPEMATVLPEVTIVGAGAIGGRIAADISRLRLASRIYLIDSSLIMASDLITHAATREEIGMRKAEAVEKRVRSDGSAEVVTISASLDNFAPPSEVVFVCMDESSQRERLYSGLKSSIPFLIDLRLDIKPWEIISGEVVERKQVDSLIKYFSDGVVKKPARKIMDRVHANTLAAYAIPPLKKFHEQGPHVLRLSEVPEMQMERC